MASKAGEVVQKRRAPKSKGAASPLSPRKCAVWPTAAKEIKELISDSVQQVKIGRSLVAQAGTTMEEVVGSVRQVNSVISEISLSSRQQSEGIEQINDAVLQMDNVTQQNAALVEQAAAAAQAMQEQAFNLSNLVGIFTLNTLPILKNSVDILHARLKLAAP